MCEVVLFGKTMTHLSSPDFQRLEQTNLLDVNGRESELKAALAVQRLGLKTAYVTRLTSNSLGRMIEDLEMTDSRGPSTPG